MQRRKRVAILADESTERKLVGLCRCCTWLDEVITLAGPFDLFDSEPSPLENTPKLRIWIRAMNGMNPPFQKCQSFPCRITRCQRAQRWERAFTSAVNVRQLEDDSIWRALKMAKDLGGTNTKHNRLTAEDKLFKLLIRQSQNLID